MKTALQCVALAPVALAPWCEAAQLVKGNEAAQVSLDAARMVKTNDALVEYPGVYSQVYSQVYSCPGSWRKAGDGSRRVGRRWVVRPHAHWLQRLHLDSNSKYVDMYVEMCVEISARAPAKLTYDAVQ